MISIKCQTWNVNWSSDCLMCLCTRVSAQARGRGHWRLLMPDVSVQGRLGNVISGILMHGPSPASAPLITGHKTVWSAHGWSHNTRIRTPGISHWLLHKLNAAWISPPSSIHSLSPIIIIIIVPFQFQCWIESWMEAWRRSEAGAQGFLCLGFVSHVHSHN